MNVQPVGKGCVLRPQLHRQSFPGLLCDSKMQDWTAVCCQCQSCHTHLDGKWRNRAFHHCSDKGLLVGISPSLSL